jgi:hypothetical protein
VTPTAVVRDRVLIVLGLRHATRNLVGHEKLGTAYTNASADKQRSAAVAALVAQAKLAGF